MAVITSLVTGNALTGATWVGGIVPALGDSVNIASTHIITNNGTWTTGDDTATSIVVNGTLKASRTSSSSLTVRGDLFISTGGTFDYGTEADPIPFTITAQILLNDSVAPGHNKWGLRTSESSNWAGFRVWGADKTGRTTMSSALNTDTVVTVADSTGWVLGDILAFGCLSVGIATHTFRAITGIAGLSITISGNLGNASPSGRTVWNVTRNVRIRGSLGNLWRSHVAIRVGGAYNVTNSIEIGPCEFGLTGGTGAYYQFGGLNLSWDSANSLNGTAVKKIYRPVFNNIWSISGTTVSTIDSSGSCMINIFGNQAASFTMIEPLCAVTAYHWCQVFNGASVVMNNPSVLGTYFLFTTGYSQGVVGGIVNNGYFESVISNLIGYSGISATFNNTVVNGIYDIVNGNFVAFGNVIYNNCTIGGTLGVFDSPNLAVANGSYGTAEFNSCTFPSSIIPAVSSGSANLNNMNPSATFMFRNKNNNPILNEKYVQGGRIFRDNSLFNRSTSSLQMGAWYAGVPTDHNFPIPVIAGQTIRIKGFCQFNTTYGTATPPTLTVSGLGITPVTFTCPATENIWFPIDITVTNPQSYPGSFNIKLSGQSASNSQSANFWFDGIVIPDFVTTSRHYGFLFNSLSYVTVDPVITQTNEATVGSYTGFSDNGTTFAIIAGHSFNEAYDWDKYNSVQTANLSQTPAILSTDKSNATSNRNFSISGVQFTGTGKKIVTTGTVTTSGGGTSRVVIQGSNGTTGYIDITGLSGHSVYLQNGSGTQLDYQASVTGTYSFFIPAGSTGIWTYVIKKPGYTYQKGTINASTGGINTVAVNTSQKLNPDGSAMYTASTSSFCTVSFSGSTQASINISNGVVTDQQAFDTTETALITNAGMIWLVTKGECSIFLSFGGNYLFMSTGWRLKRASVGDVNATLGAFVQSADGTAVDGVNGGIEFLTSSTTADIWNYATRTLTSSTGLTTEEHYKLMNITNSGGGLYSGSIFSAQDRKNIIDTLEKVKTIENTDLTEITQKLDEIDSHNSIARDGIIDTIKETEIEICSDIVRSKKELKEDNISTRNLVRQKTKNLAELAQKQVDSDVKEEKMIESIKEEFKSQEEQEKTIDAEFEKQEMDDIVKEFQRQESKQP